MSTVKDLYKQLPEPLTGQNFTLIFGEYLVSNIPKDEMILACMARVLSHLEFVYTTDNLTLLELEEAYSQAALKVVEMVNNEEGLTRIRNPAAYIFNMTKNSLVDIYRNKPKEEISHMLDNLAKESQECDYIDLIDTLCMVSRDDTDVSIIKMRAQGITNREISETLGISASTVSLRLNNLYRRYKTIQKGSNNE